MHLSCHKPPFAPGVLEQPRQGPEMLELLSLESWKDLEAKSSLRSNKGLGRAGEEEKEKSRQAQEAQFFLVLEQGT